MAYLIADALTLDEEACDETLAELDPEAAPAGFSHVVSMFNTVANIEPCEAVWDVMRRLAGPKGRALASVYSERSVPVRRGWYESLGLGRATVDGNAVVTEAGLRSEFFTAARARETFAGCEVEECGEIGLLVIAPGV